MKNIVWLTAVYSLLLLVSSCTKSEEPLKERDLNYDLNCEKDSTCFYYTFNAEKIFLDYSTLCITLKFSNEVSKEYLKYIIEKNNELDSISIINEDENLAYGYLKNNMNCENIQTLLTRLTTEEQIICANPNFITKEAKYRGIQPNNKEALMAMTDEFIVENHNSLNLEKINALILQTKTTLLRDNGNWAVISADKNSVGNSLEMSRYFYETGSFEYSHPNFLVSISLFK
ncbi:MAG: hypothetical protein Q7U54_20435 [Bacteroidales bacterium]|nr:hypothetical protein [Bacteroidales bacterium]